MDENLKALLLLNSTGSSNAASWRRFAASRPYSCLWRGTYDEISALGISKAAHARLSANFASAWAEREYEMCVKKGIRLIACTDKDYPRQLNDLAEPPLLLYWQGTVQRLPSGNVSVIGTRKATTYGRRTAQTIGEMCARLGVGLVSGGASGIDGCAHTGACRGGGTTYAVFGTGIDQCYPSSHWELFAEIREKGALISEYPLGSKGEPWRFPRRNRIVAALGEKIIVVEAPRKSGAMITARLALELGREVWAVPGRIDEEIASGTNTLIYDGAHPLICAEVFSGSFSGQTTLLGGWKPKNPPAASRNLSEQERLLMNELKLHGERTVDNISLEVKMSAAEVIKIMAVLAAKGLIYSTGPGRFSAKT